MNSFSDKLNNIYARITSSDVTAPQTAGEMRYYIFDYPPEEELKVREYIPSLLEKITKQNSDISIKHVDLFEIVFEYLEGKNILDKGYDIQQKKGDKALLDALAGSLNPERFTEKLKEVIGDPQPHVILLTGIGSVYPMIRLSVLLNNIQPILPNSMLIAFYPGVYDTKSLRLFGKLKDSNYYRAFKLLE